MTDDELAADGVIERAPVRPSAASKCWFLRFCTVFQRSGTRIYALLLVILVSWYPICSNSNSSISLSYTAASSTTAALQPCWVEHKRPLAGLHLLDQSSRVRSKCEHRLNVLFDTKRSNFVPPSGRLNVQHITPALQPGRTP
jgi:hypothetical protein